MASGCSAPRRPLRHDDDEIQKGEDEKEKIFLSHGAPPFEPGGRGITGPTLRR